MTNTITAHITDTLRAELEMAGRTACAAGDSAAPALSSEVRTALEGLPVGTEYALEVMEAFTDGYDSQRRRELAE